MNQSFFTTRILVFCFLIITLQSSLAQNLHDTRMVGMLAFATNTYSDSIAARNIHAAVVRILVQTKRFTVLEMDKWQLTQDEIERQRGSGFLERDVIQKGKSLGAQVLIVGFVKNAEVYRNGANFSARVDYELKYIDVETGKTINAAAFTGDSEDFHDQAGKIGSGLTKTAGVLFLSGSRRWKTAALASTALSMMSESDKNAVKGKTIDAIEESAGRVNTWVHRTFDFTLYLLQTYDDGKSVLIQGGEDVGMKKGTKLKMVLVTDMQTPTGVVRDEEPVADLEVEEVRAATSKCKVKAAKGGKSLQEASKNNNMRIVFN